MNPRTRTARAVLLLAAVLSCLCPLPASSDVFDGIIATVAGNGLSGYSGDGVPATQTALYGPTGIATDGFGNIYIADYLNERIRRVDANGIITTVAGCGRSTHYPHFAPLGDGGPATQASLSNPCDVTLDGAGNLYIVDSGNNRIRKVDVNGIITTVAGNGYIGLAGDGGPATQARLWMPEGVVVDGAGNIYIADYANSRIRKVDANGIITSAVGTGMGPQYSGDGGPAAQAGIANPAAVALDGLGNLYIADRGNHRIRKVDAGGIITTVAGIGVERFSGDGGPATQAALARPHGIMADGLGNLFIADTSNNRIRRVDASGIITTVAGNGVHGFSGDGGLATQAALSVPHTSRLDANGDLVISDQGNNRIRRVKRGPVAEAGADQTVSVGQLVTLDGGGSYDPARNYPLSYRWEIRSAPAGNTAALSGETTVTPSFAPNAIGDYVVSLVVTDAAGLPSGPDTVTVSTVNSPPVADAGPDQQVVRLGDTVLLDGSRSYDVDGDPLAFSWTMDVVPEGSLAVLDNAASPTPSFTADVHGDYVIRLVVGDGRTTGQPDSVRIGFLNIAPVADAGGNQSVIQGASVRLNGAGSRDANLDPLTYAWSLVSIPAGSGAALENPAAVESAFTADLPGQYIASLVVNDGFADSLPSNVTIVAITAQDAVRLKLMELIAAINVLDDGAFRNGHMKNALTNKINAVLGMVEGGEYQGALDKMSNDIGSKADGCAALNSPDANDWLRSCDVQERIHPLIDGIITLLFSLR